MADIVRITDVAPRDGLQNEPGAISTADKARLVRSLIEAGVDEIEVSSFVSPKWVPQLGDAAELFAELTDSKPPDVCFSALTPNEKGLSAALHVNRRAGRRLIDKIAVFTAASETFSQRNTAASIAQTLERFRPVVPAAHAAGLLVRGYVSCAIACPFEGPIDPQRVIDVSERLLALELDELDIADTIGAATPESIGGLLGALIERLGPDAPGRTTIHLHDTFGRAGACVAEALRLGFRSFDAAAGGLGGCPYASTPDRRAPGNLATERLVHVVRDAGFDTHVDAQRLAAAGALARSIVESARGAAPPR
ncbi:MAG: hydroxymethylglutaryl-CoA lyase [Phycisphaerae bacterium]|jgi:hydroxymethylglutaryl-CoA lyase